jgi:hypothetical protein
MCYNCRNFDEKKRQQHSMWMTGKDIRMHNQLVPKQECARDVRARAITTFQSLSDTERAEYFKTHLDANKMANVMASLVSLHNGNIPCERLAKCEYWDVYPSHNQMRFSPVFFDSINCEVIRITQPVMKCEQCDTQWRCKDLKPIVTAQRILCPSCKLCRRTFKIRGTLNINGDKVVYQSRPEYEFITWCKENNIVVVNGPCVPYSFQNKKRIYKVDFMLPCIKYLVEVKDDHCWHKFQVQSGQWDCKMSSVSSLVEIGEFSRFLLLTPKTKRNCLQEILTRISKI